MHWNQNKNQKQEVENQINSKFTAKSKKKDKNEKTHFNLKSKILKFSKFFSSVERKFRKKSIQFKTKIKKPIITIFSAYILN